MKEDEEIQIVTGEEATKLLSEILEKNRQHAYESVKSGVLRKEAHDSIRELKEFFSKEINPDDHSLILNLLPSNMDELFNALLEYDDDLSSYTKLQIIVLFKLAFDIKIATQRKSEESYKKEVDSLKTENLHINREMENRNNWIKNYKEKSRTKINRILKNKNIPPNNELYDLANDSRLKNGKINFSELGRKLGRSNHTAKEWCKYHNIK